jgi:type I phosphodiesterase/nucleotide pyrophosphatase
VNDGDAESGEAHDTPANTSSAGPIDSSPAARADGKPAGLLVIQLDGVASPTLRRAMDRGLTPTISRWLETGRHRLVTWDCGVPSQTSSSQAGILYGRNDDIPGFRWYEKDRRRLMVSNHPGDAAELERRLSTSEGLLAHDGSSVANLLSGHASRTALTMSALGRGLQAAGDSSELLNLGAVWPMLVAAIREVFVEIGQGWRQRLRNVRPRVGRGGSFPFLRAASNVLLRDLTLHLLRKDIQRGVAVAYSTFVGYDVVAHHAGPERPESLKVLHELDALVGELERVAAGAPRAYEFVLLSDHGQSQGATFRQRHGKRLEDLVRQLARTRSVAAPTRRAEGWGYLNALLSEAVRGDRRAARAARTVLRRRRRGPYVEVGPDRYRKRRENAEVVVCASGSLGLIYLADWPGRLSLEGINQVYPGLIEGLAAHEGIGFVMVGSERLGPVVLGRGGFHQLDENRTEGRDPLEPFGPRAAEHLRRLHAFPHVGDLVVNGRFDPSTGELNAFEELVGSHGGLGGDQNRAFLLFPAGWRASDGIVGAEAIHGLLRGWVGELESPAS